MMFPYVNVGLRSYDRYPVRPHRRGMAEIADEWGFSEPSAFSRAYQDLFGLPPSRERGRGAHDAADSLEVQEVAERKD